jgi:hypothetical protein
MINAPLRSATCRIAARRPALPRNATQRSDFPAASAPGWPENHPITRRALSLRAASHRRAKHLVATRRVAPQR